MIAQDTASHCDCSAGDVRALQCLWEIMPAARFRNVDIQVFLYFARAIWK